MISRCSGPGGGFPPRRMFTALCGHLRAGVSHVVRRTEYADHCLRSVERAVPQAAMKTPHYTTDDLRRLDRQHIWHPFTHMKLWHDDPAPLVIVAAEGMHLIDSDGNRYLDGVSSLWCNVHGHRVPEIDEAIRRQLDKVAHTTMLGLASEPAILLADRLMKLVPPGLTKVFYSDAGATATEVSFKLAAQYWYNVGKPEKCEFVGFTEAYHGDTVGAMSIGRTAAFHRPYFPLLFKVHYAPTPFLYRHKFDDSPVVATPASRSSVVATPASRSTRSVESSIDQKMTPQTSLLRSDRDAGVATTEEMGCATEPMGRDARDTS